MVVNEWREEMVNNRNKSVVTAMKWNVDGRQICIVYRDGMVIVGGVDGQRMWSKELKVPLAQCEWSSNSKQILFGTLSGEVHVYDYTGSPMMQMDMPCLDGFTGRPVLAALSWCVALRGRSGGGRVIQSEREVGVRVMCVNRV